MWIFWKTLFWIYVSRAIRFCFELRPQLVIPIHYDKPKDKDVIPTDFVKLLENSNINSKLLKLGEVLYVYKDPSNILRY